MIVRLDFPAPELFPNAKAKSGGRHRAMPAKAKAKHDAFMLAKQAMGDWKAREGLIPISIVFVPPDRIKRDWDGMAGAAKHALDGIAMAIGVDDSRFRPVMIDIVDAKKPGAMLVAVGVEIRTGVNLEVAEV